MPFLLSSVLPCCANNGRDARARWGVLLIASLTVTRKATARRAGGTETSSVPRAASALCPPGPRPFPAGSWRESRATWCNPTVDTRPALLLLRPWLGAPTPRQHSKSSCLVVAPLTWPSVCTPGNQAHGRMLSPLPPSRTGASQKESQMRETTADRIRKGLSVLMVLLGVTAFGRGDIEDLEEPQDKEMLAADSADAVAPGKDCWTDQDCHPSRRCTYIPTGWNTCPTGMSWPIMDTDTLAFKCCPRLSPAPQPSAPAPAGGPPAMSGPIFE